MRPSSWSALETSDLRESWIARVGVDVAAHQTNAEMADAIIAEFDAEGDGTLSGVEISAFFHMMLQAHLAQIIASPRPMTLTFSRPKPETIQFTIEGVAGDRDGMGKQKDGSFIDTLPDGATRQTWPNGACYVLHADGSSTGKHIDGSSSHTSADGHRVTKFPDNSILSEDFGSNMAMREWPDGRMQQRLEDNRVIECSHLSDDMVILKEDEHELPPVVLGGARALGGLSPLANGAQKVQFMAAKRSLLHGKFASEES